jgi:hypothetical protein
MKTHVIQLETYDDVYSARDKMVWGKSNQILLVIPAENYHLRRKLDLVLLQRQAKTIGSKLGIVSKDPQIKGTASELSIPIFENTSRAQSQVWRQGRRITLQSMYRQKRIPLDEIREQVEKISLPKIEITWVRILIFGIAVFSLLAVLIVLLPHAVIKIPVQEKIQIKDLEITADPGIITLSISGVIPAHQLTLTVSESGTVQSSGKLQIPAEKSKGFIEVSNISSKAVTIPEGTVIHSSTHPDINFETTKTVVVEVGNSQKTEVPVIALNTGSKSNLNIGELNEIEEDLNAKVVVSNPEPTIGGTDLTVSAPTEQDYSKLKTLLLSKLASKALEQFNQDLTSEQELLEGTLSEDEITSESRSPVDHSPAEQLTLSMQVQYSIYSIEKTDLYQSAQMNLDSSLPDGWSKKGDSLYVEEVSPAEIISHNPVMVEMKVQAAQLLVPKIDQIGLVQSLLGKSKKAATEIIGEKLELISAPNIRITPSIWGWIPFLPLNVDLSFQ